MGERTKKDCLFELSFKVSVNRYCTFTNVSKVLLLWPFGIFSNRKPLSQQRVREGYCLTICSTAEPGLFSVMKAVNMWIVKTRSRHMMVRFRGIKVCVPRLMVDLHREHYSSPASN